LRHSKNRFLKGTKKVLKRAAILAKHSLAGKATSYKYGEPKEKEINQSPGKKGIRGKNRPRFLHKKTPTGKGVGRKKRNKKRRLEATWFDGAPTGRSAEVRNSGRRKSA